jgi:hypothetical protein
MADLEAVSTVKNLPPGFTLPRLTAPDGDAETGFGLSEAVRQTLAAWAMDELAVWRLNQLNAAATSAKFKTINETSRSIYILAFSGKSVQILEKPATINEIPSGKRRAFAYLGFFEALAEFLPDDFRAELALETNDKVVEKHDVPVFCFQKRRGERSVLLPDIDFLNNDFYQDKGFGDPHRYTDKMPSAIFVGSTSGGQVTPDVARSCALPRLRAARFFQDNSRVDFLLPQIVQTTSQEASDILKKMPFCQVAKMSWPEQKLRRFLISMDGNGATCSRVAIALKSNSILLKYGSDDLLYYFRYLQPWLHYIPVTNDHDIEKILDLETAMPEFFEAIAANGTKFAEDYISHQAVFVYTIQLLLIYAKCFSDTDQGNEATRPAAPPKAPAVQLPHYVVLLAHVQGRGDVNADSQGWVGEAGTHRSVEGFAFSLGSQHFNRQFTYRLIRADGSLDARVPAGHFCGTRGAASPLHGFMIEYATDARDVPAIVYEGIFSDGFSSGPLTQGVPCKSGTGATLVAMRIGLAAT